MFTNLSIVCGIILSTHVNNSLITSKNSSIHSHPIKLNVQNFCQFPYVFRQEFLSFDLRTFALLFFLSERKPCHLDTVISF